MQDRISPDWSIQPVLDWVLAEGRLLPRVDTLVSALGQRLAATGAPIWRLRLSLRTLHPLVTAIGAIWERETGTSPLDNVPHGLESRASYIGSPMEQIATTGEPFRQSLLAPLGPDDHIVMHELKARGATDYFGQRLEFQSTGGAVLIFTSDAPQGFSDSDLGQFRRLADALAPVAEVFRLNHLSQAITQAYLGPRTGQRVLEGQITRGHIDTITAALMISDMRGWTALNATRPAEETMALANRYFEYIAAAVDDAGGEILKLMGDGVLAIFPEDDPARACSAALCAAQAAQAQAPNLGTGFGIGLHFGEVLYGNIGSDTRLDFTVLGPAVNLAARLEALCADLDQPILYSAAFSAALPDPGHQVATRQIKGLRDPQPIFAP